jgi:hypothetical protein
MRKSTVFISVLAFILVAGLSFGTQAMAANLHAGNHMLRGKIVSVAQDGSSMVVQAPGKNGKQITVTFAAHVSITIDGKGAMVSQLAAGDHVRVNPKSGDATLVEAKTPQKHVKPVPVANN